eukprot:CAMPEP_0185195446 /NCGR_PEP_ID=MMETSP1140-20130426/34584_1 /TAXON_ID=298111 /ORGANISM="Pavlova sp., Strain CCMP459" /LENGTH=90 /DNA_ID=CAMNT_0027762421 /DNA_START=86 /DNA_END=355 /DNA_ORIENTATION=+
MMKTHEPNAEETAANEYEPPRLVQPPSGLEDAAENAECGRAYDKANKRALDKRTCDHIPHHATEGVPRDEAQDGGHGWRRPVDDVEQDYA